MSTDGFLRQAMPSQSRTGRARGVLLIIACLIGIGSCCCLFPFFIGLAYEEDMVAGYAVWAVDALEEAAWEELVPGAREALYRLALSLGGTLTGEHGIGVTRRRYLPLALDAAQIELMRQIKAVFDPNYILNPGKIFP